MFTLRRKIYTSAKIFLYSESLGSGDVENNKIKDPEGNEPAQYKAPSPQEIADGRKVGTNNQEIKKTERGEETESNENDSGKQSHAPEDVKKAEQKGNQIAEKSQAPALNRDQTEAAELGLQQKEALYKTLLC